jgi:hypothetical protein
LNVSISIKLKNDSKKLTHFSATPYMELIPDNILGLEYTWYPIVITSKDQDTLIRFMDQVKCIICPCINTFRGPDLTISASYPEGDMINHILNDGINLGLTLMGYYLGIKPRFINPKEIMDAIDKNKSIPSSHLIGCIPVFDTLELVI